MNYTVMSFGPAVIRDGNSILQVAEVLYQYHQAGRRIVAVVSALDGVTDMLAESIQLSSYARVYNKLLSIHQSVARKLVRDASDRTLLIQDITDILESYNWLGRSMINRAPTPAETATILAIGERLSARLLAGHFQNRGIRATVVNASEVIITGDDYPTAAPDMDATQARMAARLLPRLDEGYLALVGGGIGGTVDGKTTRLSEGANLSSAVLAAATEADGLWLWTDRNGIMTADPALVPAARTLATLTAADVDELAHHGVNMPSAQTLAPVLAANIPVFIRSIYHPDQPGTAIQADDSSPMQALIAKDRLRCIAVSGERLDPHNGIAALARQNTPAQVALAGADTLLYFVGAAEANSARLALEDAFRGQQATCTIEAGQVGLVTAINGESAGIQAALDAEGIALIRSVQMLSSKGTGHQAQAAVVATEDLPRALNAIHERLLAHAR